MPIVHCADTAHASERLRHALVIGVGAYERAADLQNPTNDALAVAERLRRDGYALHGGGAQLDRTRAQMLAAFRAFAAGVPQGAEVVVFLAGHGLSQGGDTYLIPADDGQLGTRDDLATHGVPLRALTARLAARPGVDVSVWVDACRANGLRGASGLDAPGAGGTGDLVAGADGSMALVYAASPGQIAADGVGENSPFTLALLAALDADHATTDALIAAVARDVSGRTDGAQRPFVVRSFGPN